MRNKKTLADKIAERERLLEQARKKLETFDRRKLQRFLHSRYKESENNQGETEVKQLGETL